jgi:hypothetical protein
MIRQKPLTEALTRAAIVAAATAGLGAVFYLSLSQIVLLAAVSGAFAGLIRLITRKRTGE